jgi:hypothetical protein
MVMKIKIRLDKSLLQRARICADAVDASLSDWCKLALRALRKGELKNVAKGAKHKNATREGSAVCTLPCEKGEVDEMRAAIQSAVVYCEKKRKKAFKCSLVEGRDYVVAGEW